MESSWVGFDIALDTLQIILQTILPANLLTGAKQPQTEHNDNQELFTVFSRMVTFPDGFFP